MKPKTYITTRLPWGIVPRCGHRLLCADGVIRAAQLAPTPDTFFSHPASVRFKGKHVSGYMTTDTASGLSSDSPHVYVFRAHNGSPPPLCWPSRPDMDAEKYRKDAAGTIDFVLFDADAKEFDTTNPARHAATIAKALP